MSMRGRGVRNLSLTDVMSWLAIAFGVVMFVLALIFPALFSSSYHLEQSEFQDIQAFLLMKRITYLECRESGHFLEHQGEPYKGDCRSVE